MDAQTKLIDAAAGASGTAYFKLEEYTHFILRAVCADGVSTFDYDIFATATRFETNPGETIVPTDATKIGVDNLLFEFGPSGAHEIQFSYSNKSGSTMSVYVKCYTQNKKI